jgi:hypothetical protein
MMDLLKHCRISIAGKKYRIFAKSLTVIYKEDMADVWGRPCSGGGNTWPPSIPAQETAFFTLVRLAILIGLQDAPELARQSLDDAITGDGRTMTIGIATDSSTFSPPSFTAGYGPRFVD